MNRRKFIQKAGLVTGSAFVAPYILPSGRLFAASGSQLAPHVVVFMFGGGVRQQESVLQRYLEDSQPQTSGRNPGNIMYNMFSGAPPTQKIVYGPAESYTNLPGDTPIPKVLSQSIDQQGTTFREVLANSPGHYNGFVSLLQGKTTQQQGLRQRPLFPTMFEYTRRHLNVPASKVWFIGESIKNSIPLLNYSGHRDYGMPYGANFFAPPTTFGLEGCNSFLPGDIFDPDHEMKRVHEVKTFLDNYYANIGGRLADLGNTEYEKYDIKQFIRRLQQNQQGKDVISCAIEVMKQYKPTLTVINMMAGVDSCHSNFTSYLRGMHDADHKVGVVWDAIQNIPEMQNNTIMIVCPEHGRNLKANPILDENDWYGFDHSDQNTSRVFAQIVGPGIPANHSVGGEGNQIGQTNDCVLTVADILGYKTNVQTAGHVIGTTSLLEQL